MRNRWSLITCTLLLASCSHSSTDDEKGKSKAAGRAVQPVALTEANFESEVLKSKSPVLVDFWASWCGPCMQIAPDLEELSTEWAGVIKVAKVDHDESMSLVQKYKIKGLPTLVLFKDGREAGRMVGAPRGDARAAIAAWTEGTLKSTP